MYQQKPAWYFNKKTQEFIENKDSENRENLPKDYYSDVGVHPYKQKLHHFLCSHNQLQHTKYFLLEI
jgi:hypothetical protein